MYYDYSYNWYNFALRYNRAFLDAALESYKSFISEDRKQIDSKKIRNTMRASFDSTLRNFIDAWLNIVKISGYDKYGFFPELLSFRSKLLEPLRDNLNRTPSEEIKIKGKFHLHHYKSTAKKIHKTPILIVYSLINRYYILDLIPNASVINNLLQQGFDVFATDWGIPGTYDKEMTLEDYAHEYIENSVDEIKEITGSDKISLFGYCWGGVFSLIYSATHPENVKNLVLHATPVDFSEEREIIENWTTHLNADKLVDTLGNVPGWFVNLTFILRNPVEIFLKYPIFFSEPRSLDEILRFFWIETWLYDGRPIIGDVYRKIINDICKKNLLIKNRMQVSGHTLDLGKITMPVLNIIGSKDDLVPSESSKPILSVVGSTDKKLIEFPTGHVGLCTGRKAHEQLWPEVGKWLAQRS
jgi:class III poly(R)-hydroxyalkanoic acid synthase PhaC subunit